MRYLFLILVSCLPLLSQAQEFVPRCNFDSHYLEQLKSSDYRDMLILEEAAFQKFLQEKSIHKNVVYTIPVVVHIIKNETHENWVDMDITDADVYRQIEILNETYNLLNEDVSQTPEVFEEFIGNPQIEFCLATVDPNGYATTGINRYSTDVTSFSTALDNIKRSEDGGADSWDTDSYLNIWVGRITTGVLGYSDTPTANIPDDEHGLVVGYPYFGENEHEYYGMGKTAVHEIGHYLNLKHPWGSGNCNSNGDWVDDTPMSEGPYYSNPEHPQISCESEDMFMNYMDYVNDSSMVMFSQGQVDRMHYALENYRPTLQESNGCGIPSLIAEPQVIHASAESASDGLIHLNIASGVPPFTINWQEGEMTDSLVNLSVGDYSVQVTDSIGQELNLDFSISYYGNIYHSDNFETYSVDSLLHLQSDIWTAFCEDSFAANIATIAPVEGLQYLEINAADGLNTFIRDLGGIGVNAYDLSFKMYVPTGRSAAYTIYHYASCSGSMSAYEIQFNDDGQAHINTGGQNIPFTFPQNQWFSINQLIDMDRDLVELSVADELIDTWSFDWTIEAENGNPRLGALVFNDEVDSLSQVHYFIDDFKMVLAQNSDLGIEQVMNDLDVVLYPNPTQDKINIRANEEMQETCKVIIFNTLGQVLETKDWNVKRDNDLSISVDRYEQGIYFVRIQSDKAFKTLKFIKQN